MTTIAYAGGIMAADSHAQDNFGLRFTADKLHRGQCGANGTAMTWLFGSAGSNVIAKRLAQMVRVHLETAPAPLNENDSVEYLDRLVFKINPALEVDKDNENSALLAVRNKSITRLYNKQKQGFTPVTIRPYHSIGSGRDYALAAMFYGKEAPEAVACAMEFDAGTGGEIKTIGF